MAADYYYYYYYYYIIYFAVTILAQACLATVPRSVSCNMAGAVTQQRGVSGGGALGPPCAVAQSGVLSSMLMAIH